MLAILAESRLRPLLLRRRLWIGTFFLRARNPQ